MNDDCLGGLLGNPYLNQAVSDQARYERARYEQMQHRAMQQAASYLSDYAPEPRDNPVLLLL